MQHVPEPLDESGEKFRSYVDQRQDVSRDRARMWGSRLPDFTLSGPLGAIVCEIFSPVLLLDASVGAFDPVEPLTRAFKDRKRKQGEVAAASGVPYVVIIGSANSSIGFEPLDLAQAMFGRSPKSGGLNRGSNTRYSALAIVSSFNPTQWRLEAALAERDDKNRSTTERIVAGLTLASELSETGQFEEGADQVSRLRVVHNPWAANPLDLEWFSGPHDQQWTLAADGNQLALARQGQRMHEVPGWAPASHPA